MPTLSSTALLTEAQAKSYLNITGATPDQLIDMINGVSNRIEDHLGRKILSQSYSEIYDFPDQGELVLKQPDVTAVGLVSNSTVAGLTAMYTGTDTHARVEVTDAAVVLTSRVGSTTTTTTKTFAALVTTTAMASAMTTDWTFTAPTSVPSAYLVRAGNKNAKNATVTLDAWADYTGDYQTDYPGGIIRFSSWGNWNSASGDAFNSAVAIQQQCRIDYTAGLSAVPGNVEITALEVLAEAWGRIGRDPSLQSESIGDYSYSVAIPQIDSKSRWVDLLSTYVRELP